MRLTKEGGLSCSALCSPVSNLSDPNGSLLKGMFYIFLGKRWCKNDFKLMY